MKTDVRPETVHIRGIRSLTTIAGKSLCFLQTRADAEKDLYGYLRLHVMQFDLPFLETLGFNEEDKALPDGLSSGMIGNTIDLALQSKIELNYTDALPHDVFREFVLNYASLNEARSNWRPLLWKKLRHLVNPEDDIDTVVRASNTAIWKILAPADQDQLIFKSGSTPLVFDPMSILSFGYASCTGFAILFVNALRTLGVPARVAGTAAWYQEREEGNHNWVEVWKDGTWYFMEPTLTPDAPVDDLTQPPCHRWFCSKGRFTGFSENTTFVYAARMESTKSTFFPMAWEWTNFDVPGEDVSSYYQEQCGKC